MYGSSMYPYVALKAIIFENDMLAFYVFQVNGTDGFIFISQSLVLADRINVIHKVDVITAKECVVVLGHLQV